MERMAQRMVLDLTGLFAAEGESLSVDETMDLSDLSFSGHTPVDTVRFTGRVHNRAGVVELEGRAVFLYRAPCDRCTAWVERGMTVPVRHTLVQSLHEEERDGELMPVPDGKLDLDELVSADVVLSLPAKFLCEPDCKGLCPQCGKNLNEGECDCKHSHVDPRLEALKQLLE